MLNDNEDRARFLKDFIIHDDDFIMGPICHTDAPGDFIGVTFQTKFPSSPLCINDYKDSMGIDFNEHNGQTYVNVTFYGLGEVLWLRDFLIRSQAPTAEAINSFIESRLCGYPRAPGCMPRLH